MKKAIILIFVGIAIVTLLLLFVVKRQSSDGVLAVDSELQRQDAVATTANKETEFAELLKNAKPEDTKALVELVDYYLRRGYYFQREEDYLKAIEILEKLDELGNSWGTYTLGNCYQNGWGVEKDDAKAFELFKKAAELGDAAAQYALAGCYVTGIGVEIDFDEALKWYRKIHEQNPKSIWAGHAPRSMEALLRQQEEFKRERERREQIKKEREQNPDAPDEHDMWVF